MKLIHMEFVGGLREAVGHLNENGLAPFDVVSIRATSRKDIGSFTEVVLLVPVEFDEARWRKDAPETVDYQRDLYAKAAEHRRGLTGPPR